MNSLISLTLRSPFSIAVSLILTVVASSTSLAQPQMKELSTPEGLLRIHPGKGTDCFDCTVLSLNGKQVLRDQYIFIDAIYPSPSDPQLVSISTSSGGNCCPPSQYMLDFSVKPHLMVHDAAFGTDIARSEKTGSSSHRTRGPTSLGISCSAFMNTDGAAAKRSLRRRRPNIRSAR